MLFLVAVLNFLSLGFAFVEALAGYEEFGGSF